MDDSDPATKYFDTHRKSLSLIDFIEDSSRTEPVVGLQYVVEIKAPGSTNGFIKCDVCCVKGHIKTMREHLVGLQHIKAYMEMHYFSELQSIKRSDNKSKVVKLIKDFAREIERAEGTQSLKVEYISAADMKIEVGDRINENNDHYAFSNQQGKSPFLDRRQMALQYSETFKISSRTEASAVLKLTQQLSDNLEQYFLRCKGLDILPAICASKDPSMHPDSQSTSEVAVFKTEEPMFSSRSSNNLLSTETMLEVEEKPKRFSSEQDDRQLGDDRRRDDDRQLGDDRRRDDRRRDDDRQLGNDRRRDDGQLGNDRRQDDCQRGNDPGSQSRKRRKTEDPDQIPFISSSSIPHKYDEPYQRAPAETSLHAASVVKADSQHKPPVSRVTQKEPVANVSVENSDQGAASSHTSSQEAPPSAPSHGKTSKSLSPDILQLLKGKDASTVTNILKTLSPFYPALQDINIEILAQVLVNTGALD